MQKEIEDFDFVRSVNSEFSDALKTMLQQNLKLFDDSCEEIHNSKAVFALVTA